MNTTLSHFSAHRLEGAGRRCDGCLQTCKELSYRGGQECPKCPQDDRSQLMKGLSFFENFIYLWPIGSSCCAGRFPAAVRGFFLVAGAPPVAEHGLQGLRDRLRSCGAPAQFFRARGVFLAPGSSPSPALTGRFSTTEPPAKPTKELANSRDFHRFLLQKQGELCQRRWGLGNPQSLAGEPPCPSAGELQGAQGRPPTPNFKIIPFLPYLPN